MQDLGAEDDGCRHQVLPRQNGYAMVVDVSNPQTPVLWADPAVDITNEIVKLYDQAHPGTGAAAAPARPAPAKPAPSAAKPPAKKQ